MSDGTVAPDSLLETASWRVNSLFTLSNSTGETVTVSYRVAIDSAGYIQEKEINPQYGGIIPPKGKALEASIGNITAGADISNGVTGFSTENIFIPLESESTNNISSAIDNQISSTTVDRKTTYFKYDNNSNMIEERVVKVNGEEISSYRYDEFYQLVEVRNPQGTTIFTYYPTGLRETKVHGNEVTKFYYAGQNVILEEVNNSVKARNIFGIIGPVVRQITDSEGNMNSYFYIYNGHMDVVALLDENGDIIKNYEYDIYGEIFPTDGITIDNPFRYAGQYYDKETGLYYLRARYYDPGLMRFITEDTNRGDVKDPLSLNLYTYCYGNPLKYYDPSGHTGELAAGWFGSMWWLLAADGPIPIGDDIYVIGGGLVYAGEQLVTYGSQLVAAADKIKDKIGNSSSGDQDPNNKNRNDNQIVRNIDDIINDVNKRAGQGNCGIGSATQRQAEQAGLKWLGNGYKAIYSNNKLIGYASKDGLRVFRVMLKEGRQVYEANFVRYIIDELGNKIVDFNAHLSIIK